MTILTAGRGTRMRSRIPKTLHPLVGLPMVEHVLRAAREIAPRQIVVTLGPASNELRDALDDSVAIAWQAQPLGTGDAVRAALPVIDRLVEWVVVVFGDHPLVDGATLSRLVDAARTANPILASVSVTLDDPGPYGRYRRENGRVVGIVEARDDDAVYDGPVPVNSGMCCVRRDWLETAIERVPLSPSGEYYLTSLVELAAATEWPADPVLVVDAPPEVAHGVNDRVELAAAEAILRRRINERHMRAGVTIVDPSRAYIDADVTIGEDTRVEPGCVLRGRTVIGSGCVIGHGSTIEDSRLGDNVIVRGSWIERSEVGDNVDIGPYSHLRPGARVSPGVHIGNYVELKNASIGSGAQIGHVSYIGDAVVGERVNVGAGTITCNFDGREKHQTTIGNDVFIGSDTMLIAPVTLGDGSRTGAGSVVNRSVEPGKLVAGVPARPIRSRRAQDSDAG